MFLEMMTSKIHRAVVTETNVDYVGSITIDADLLGASGLLPNQKVQVVNNFNGARFETYIIKGEHGSGMICLNGAAARLAQPGDVIIIIGYGLMDQKEAQTHLPKVVFVDKNNKITEIGHEVHGDTSF